MGVGSSGVTDYTNTSSGGSIGVVATGGIGGAGMSAGSGGPPPPSTGYITAQDGSRLQTENADNLITET